MPFDQSDFGGGPGLQYAITVLYTRAQLIKPIDKIYTLRVIIVVYPYERGGVWGVVGGGL